MATLTTEQLERLFQVMLRIRRFDERTQELFAAGLVKGTAHSYVGQEAVAAGTCAHLRHDDAVVGNHRGHGHCIAKGARLDRMMAELMGRETGYCRGLGGSMHIADLDLNILGCNGIVAAGVPIGAGAALAARMRGTDRLVVAFFGDGGSSQGVVHETLNLTAVWKLPLVLVCENNQYALSTSSKRTIAGESIAGRAAAYGVPGVRVDGNDVFAVHEAVGHAVARARAGEGPTFVEALTYRCAPHATADDPSAYWDVERVERERENECLGRYDGYLRRLGVLTDELAEEARADALERMKKGIAAVEAFPPPDPEVVFAHAYVDPPPGMREG
jgi:TPP-dependent pyruvate/acetoin dehydrogenase alpha subunit